MGHDTNTLHLSNHRKNLLGNHKWKTIDYTGPDFSKDFHVFTLEWTPSEIIWIVDGVERAKMTENVPNKPINIILNSGVGGYYPGDPDETTQFPQYYEIDYFRYYSLEN